jgi:hypothetical protein
MYESSKMNGHGAGGGGTEGATLLHGSKACRQRLLVHVSIVRRGRHVCLDLSLVDRVQFDYLLDAATRPEGAREGWRKGNERERVMSSMQACTHMRACVQAP